MRNSDMLLHPNKLSFLQALCYWSHDATKIFDKSSIEGSQAMETANFSNSLGGWPITNCFDLLFIYLYPITTDNKPQEYYAWSQKTAFLQIKIQLILV